MLLNTTLPAYIFRQQMTINIITIIICLALVFVASIVFLRKIKTLSFKSQEIGRTILAATGIIFCYFLFFFPLLINTLHLRSNGVTTMGKTVRWINPGDSKQIKYSYIANGITYTNQCDVVYDGQEIENIQCPDGVYTVIYDSLDPENAVMDFKSSGK